MYECYMHDEIAMNIYFICLSASYLSHHPNHSEQCKHMTCIAVVVNNFVAVK